MKSGTKYFVWVSAVLILVNMYLIFVVAPPDTTGEAQRIFYLHVPMAILSFLLFFIVAGLSVWYLIKKSLKVDNLSNAFAEVGLLCVVLALVTGSIWGRPVWGVWWTWEPRLTTTLILGMIYVAYVMARAYTENQQKSAKVASVLGIIGGINVPIVYYSVKLRSIHPEGTVWELPSSMLYVFLFSILAFSVLIFVLVRLRYSVLETESYLDKLELTTNQKTLENL
ncbi:MAG TPA: cytochrome C assembly protein [Dehalococcoidia bacterium]|nr:cytochrome C assembly protein [Dehalococcoidia bacterium]